MNTQSKVYQGNGKHIVSWNAVNYFQCSIIGSSGCTVDSVEFDTRAAADAYAMAETGTDREVSRHGWSTDTQIETVAEAQADNEAAKR